MHSISVLIVKNEDVSKILELNIHQLNDKISACEYTTINMNLLEYNRVVYLQIGIDYFGRCGEQECFIHYGHDKYEELSSINAGLKKFGIDRTENEDEFDVVKLGNYRKNSDFNFKIRKTIELTFCEWLKVIKNQ